MRTEPELANRLISYLKEHGYPENSITAEYQVNNKLRVDIAIIDPKTRIPIQVFEIKAKKDSASVEMGKYQLRKYLENIGSKDIPAYLVFPSADDPYFEVLKISDEDDLSKVDSIETTLAFELQKGARITKRINEKSEKRDKVLDKFKVLCWIIAFCTFIIGLLSKLKVFELSIMDLGFLGTTIAFIIIPFVSKISVLGIEIERFVKTDKE